MEQEEFLSTEVTDDDIENGVKDAFGVMYSRDGKRLLKCINNNLESYSINEGTNVICNDAFKKSNLKRITIPNSVTLFGVNPFAGCKVVEVDSEKYKFDVNNGLLMDEQNIVISCLGGNPTVVISDSIISIGDNAFANCTNIKSIFIPNSVTKIGNGAFKKCVNLQQIVIPNSVTTIGNNAFENCENLNEIKIPNSVISIGCFAFHNCIKLQQIEIPNGVKFIKSNTFDACIKLRSVTIPNSVIEIGTGAFLSCKLLNTIIIPNTVTIIGDSSFANCKHLQNVTIHDSVSIIGNNAFAGCGSLQTITIPNSVTSIGDDAFNNCTQLHQVNIPNSVTTIGDGAFSFCLHIEQIIIPSSVTTLRKRTFAHCKKLREISIPDTITSIEKGAFKYCVNLQQISIPDSVISIGAYAFECCSNLQQIRIPDSVTTIGAGAFECCTNLQKINIPDSVATISVGLFSNCENIQSIIIPKSVLAIETRAFDNCTNMQQVVMSNSVSVIEKEAFRNCKSLSIINLPDSIKEIADSTFAFCFSLKSITIPFSVTTIGKTAFLCCHSLQQIHIPESVLSILDNAFWGCTSLQQVIIPDSIKTIGIGAFGSCKSLKHLEIPNSVEFVGKNIIEDCKLLRVDVIPAKFRNLIKINKIEINNFRAFKHETVYLSDFNCIIGKNDSGKSTIFAALEWFFDTSMELNENDFSAAAFDIIRSNNYNDLTITVEVCFSGVQIPNNSKRYDNICEKDFLNTDKCVCIKKYMYHPKSIYQGKRMGYAIQKNPFENLGDDKLISDCTIDELYQIYIKQYHSDDLSKDLLKIGKEKKEKNNSQLIESWYQTYNTQIIQQVYDRIYNCFVSEGHNTIPDRWIELENEQSFPFPMDWFLSYQCFIYTPNTPISTYLNNLFVSYNENRFYSIEDEKHNFAKLISYMLRANNVSEKISFKHKETLFLFTDDSLIFQSDDSPINIPLKNRGEGLQLTIKNAMFRMVSEKQCDNNYTIFAFEEPETHLHPSAQIEMYKTIKKLSENTNYQVFMTTHSPYIVKELAKDKTNKVIVVKRDEQKKQSNISKLYEKVLPYDSMNEINYIAFDLASEEYHQELYGQTEMDWFGESNGSKIDQIIESLKDYNYAIEGKTFSQVVEDLIEKFNSGDELKVDLVDNKFISPDKGKKKEDDEKKQNKDGKEKKDKGHSICYCVRNAIDHPCSENAIWKNYSIIELSIKVLLEINRYASNVESIFLEKVNQIGELDGFPNKKQYCLDQEGKNEETHSLVWWVKYNYIDKCDIFAKKVVKEKTIKEGIEIQKLPKKNLLDVLNATKYMINDNETI